MVLAFPAVLAAQERSFMRTDRYVLGIEQYLSAGLTFADIDGDGMVNVTDLLAIMDAWGSCTGCPADLTGDGLVNVTDLLEVIGNWSI